MPYFMLSFVLIMIVPEGYILIKKSDYDALIKRLEVLEGIAKSNSSNSSKPPSSDGLKKKIKNNRQKSTHKAGAQVGHKGKGLSPMDKVCIPMKVYQSIR
jgi:hypothetical protein